MGWGRGDLNVTGFQEKLRDHGCLSFFRSEKPEVADPWVVPAGRLFISRA